MHEITFILAILVSKEILTVVEAKAILKESQHSVLSANLGEMIAKVSKSLEVDEVTSTIEKVDARSIIG